MESILQDRTFIGLEGTWVYALDRSDVGETEQWYLTGLPDESHTLNMPGTLTGNGIGDSSEWDNWDGQMTKEAVRSLRQRHRYVGAAWYSCEVIIPKEWTYKRLVAFLERVMLQSTLWINGTIVGKQDSLSVPHQFDITDFVKFDERNLIVIRIDNRDIHKLGEYPSAYTDETQTIWNGMIGRLEIQASEPIYLNDIQLYPDIDQRCVKVQGTWVNTTEHKVSASLALSTRLMKSNKEIGDASVGRQLSANQYEILPQDVATFEVIYDMGDECKLWDEFSTNVYDMKLTAAVEIGKETILIEHHQSFGMRSFRNDGQIFEINGRPTFLRGTLECCIFPQTGHPPMDIDSWLKLYGIVKDYGLNHIRFHSWCPPRAAFDAADMLGVYVQAEGPVWMDTWNTPVGAHPEHYQYLPEEAKRIIAEYGNHPSFCIFSNGNELNGDFNLLHNIITTLQSTDDRRIHTLTTNWDRPIDAADELFCAQTVDGIGARGQYFPDALTESTMLDFREAVSLRDVPLLTHEVGQYTVYPDIEEIDKYNGALRAINLEAIKSDLVSKELDGDIRKFVHGSGMLALQLYREEIEAALRTPKLGGFQLLDLHDFPGQSTATIGILNAFWESKGLIDPSQFRAFCSETVLLLRMPKRMYEQGERFTAGVEIAHFGPKQLPASEYCWQLQDETGQVLDEGDFYCNEINFGSGIPIGSITSDALKTLTQSERITVSIERKDGEFRNEWSIWMFTAHDNDDHNNDHDNNDHNNDHDNNDHDNNDHDNNDHDNNEHDNDEHINNDHDNNHVDQHSANVQGKQEEIIISEQWDESVEQVLAEGGTVLYIVNERVKNAVPGKYYPVFWSPVHFATENPCGIYVHAEHPVFHDFPTTTYAEHHWKDLLDNSWSLAVDEFSAGKDAIVQVIPNFYHNRRLTNLIECRVGEGKLLLCGIDISRDLKSRLSARQLRHSILTYMQSEHFEPTSSVSLIELRKLLDRKVEHAEVALPGEEIAIGKFASSDSVFDESNVAAYGNDGNEQRMWLAADEAAGHWWQVDLGIVQEITGTRVKFHCPGNFLYVIQTSIDGEEWKVVANKTGQTSEEQTRVDLFQTKARFIRIVYNQQPTGVKAGHYYFEVFK